MDADDFAAEFDAEIADLIAAISATSRLNPLVSEVLDRMKATSAKLASMGGYLLDPADLEPEPEPARVPAPQPAPDPRASRL